jgi:hypothetical protein
VAQTLGNVMHLFGFNTQQAGEAMGVLQEAAAQGNMTMQQFADQTGKALAMAANLHLPLTEVAGALSALTRNGESAG